MVSVTISHVIGTVTLIMVFIGVTMFYTLSYLSLQTEALTQQLQEAADYVSTNLVDLVSLCFISPTDQLLIKSLEMPKNIGNNLYSLTLLITTDPITQENVLMVQAFFNSQPYNYMESVLPWSIGGNMKIWNGTTINNLPFPAANQFEPKISISSGGSNLVAWVLRQGNMITVGLGVMKD
jgi:hypothetical protein